MGGNGTMVEADETYIGRRKGGAPTMATGHVGGGPRLIDEHEAFRCQIELALEPVLALPQDVGAVLLDRVPGLFSE